MIRIVGWAVGLLLTLSSFLVAQQAIIIVPNSATPLSHNFLFSNQIDNSLILVYEKKSVNSRRIVVEIRQSPNMTLSKKFFISLLADESLILADFQQQLPQILCIVQNIQGQNLFTLTVKLPEGKATRKKLFFLEDARKINGSVKKIQAAGLVWNSKLSIEALLLNLISSDSTIARLAMIDQEGQLAGNLLATGRQGLLVDLAFNSCGSGYAALSETGIRILNGQASYGLRIPEEISFDPDQCRYLAVRRLFIGGPQLYFFDQSLRFQSFLTLPGQVVPGLIADSRSVLIYSKQRSSFFYPTFAGHQRILLSEVSNQGLNSVLLRTPIDASSLAITELQSEVFLLISGLTFERFHRLVLIKVNAPG